jgi:hypothetical protein
MTGNFEINRRLANERVESRLRDADIHRQARVAQGDRPDRSLGRIVLPTVAFVGRLASRLIARAEYGQRQPDAAPGVVIEPK